MSKTNADARGALHNNDLGKPGFAKAYSFAIITSLFFVLSWTGQFIAQMITVRNDAQEHGQSFEWPTSCRSSSPQRSRTGSPSSCS
jgi:hypothetical protein